MRFTAFEDADRKTRQTGQKRTFLSFFSPFSPDDKSSYLSRRFCYFYFVRADSIPKTQLTHLGPHARPSQTVKRAPAASHLQQISVQDLLAAAGAHVLPRGRNRAGGGGGRADGGGGRAAGRRVLPLHVGPLGLSVRVSLQEEAELRHARKAARTRGTRLHGRHLPQSGCSRAQTRTEAHHWRAFGVQRAARCPRCALMLAGDHLEDSVQSAFITARLIPTRTNPREAFAGIPSRSPPLAPPSPI